MELNFLIISNMANHLLNDKTIVIDKHNFNSDDDEDLELVGSDDGVDDDTFKRDCINYLHEDEGGALSQHFIPYIIIEESQAKELRDLLNKFAG